MLLFFFRNNLKETKVKLLSLTIRRIDPSTGRWVAVTDSTDTQHVYVLKLKPNRHYSVVDDLIQRWTLRAIGITARRIYEPLRMLWPKSRKPFKENQMRKQNHRRFDPYDIFENQPLSTKRYFTFIWLMKKEKNT